MYSVLRQYFKTGCPSLALQLLFAVHKWLVNLWAVGYILWPLSLSATDPVSPPSGRLCARCNRTIPPGSRSWPRSWRRWSASWPWRAEDRISQSTLGDPVRETAPCLSEEPVHLSHLSVNPKKKRLQPVPFYLPTQTNKPTNFCITLALLPRRVEVKGLEGCGTKDHISQDAMGEGCVPVPQHRKSWGPWGRKVVCWPVSLWPSTGRESEKAVMFMLPSKITLIAKSLKPPCRLFNLFWLLWLG